MSYIEALVKGHDYLLGKDIETIMTFVSLPKIGEHIVIRTKSGEQYYRVEKIYWICDNTIAYHPELHLTNVTSF